MIGWFDDLDFCFSPEARNRRSGSLAKRRVRETSATPKFVMESSKVLHRQNQDGDWRRGIRRR